jgi:hypothetical protein
VRPMNSEDSWLNPRRALAAYACVFSLFIIWASARTTIKPGSHGIGIQILSLVEILGALLFVLRTTRLLGLAILLAVFASAAAIEIYLREWPLRFVFYAACALFVQYLTSHFDGAARQSGRSAR